MTRTLRPGWLQSLVVRHGPPTYDEPDIEVQRWMWHGGESGVRIAGRIEGWQVFAWTATRSVGLRTSTEPTGPELDAVANLAGLGGPKRNGPAPAVTFAPGVAPVPLREAV